MIAGEIAVLALTSQIQVRHLLEVAGPAGATALLGALNDARAGRRRRARPARRPAPPPASPPP